MQAFEWRESLRISSVNGINNIEVYHHLNNYYTTMIDPKKSKLPDRPANPGADLAEKETQNVLRKIMNQARKSHGFSPTKVNANGG